VALESPCPYEILSAGDEGVGVSLTTNHSIRE